MRGASPTRSQKAATIKSHGPGQVTDHLVTVVNATGTPGEPLARHSVDDTSK